MKSVFKTNLKPNLAVTLHLGGPAKRTRLTVNAAISPSLIWRRWISLRMTFVVDNLFCRAVWVMFTSDTCCVCPCSTCSLISTVLLCWISWTTLLWTNSWLKCFQGSTPIHLKNLKRHWTGEISLSSINVIMFSSCKLLFHWNTIGFLCLVMLDL